VFTSNLIVDENLQNTDDLRANWQNSLAASISQKLQLKVGLVLAYDNAPALVDVPAVVQVANGIFRDAEAADFLRVCSAGAQCVENKLVTPAEKLDSRLTVPVINPRVGRVAPDAVEPAVTTRLGRDAGRGPGIPPPYA
jgi:hypothetical protein